MQDDIKLFTEHEVSEITGLSVRTLRSHRQKCVGIPYVKIERSVRYRNKDIQEYLDSVKSVGA